MKFCPLMWTFVHNELHPEGTYGMPLLLVEMLRGGGSGVLALALADSEARPGALIVIVHVLVPLE
ncbi:MAG: hypothetical protein ABMA25_29385 [Ilumatobacteraceae bacterium]